VTTPGRRSVDLAHAPAPRAALPSLTRVAARFALPLLLGVLFALGTIALVWQAPLLFETSVQLRAAPPSLLQGFALAVDGDVTRQPQPADTLRVPDLGSVAAAEQTARKEIGGPVAMTARFDLELPPGSRDFAVIVQARQREKTAALANAFAVALIRQREILLRQRNAELQASVAPLRSLVSRNQNLRPRLGNIDSRLQWVRFLESVPGAGISIRERAAVPTDPVGPRILRDVIVAFLLGCLLGLTPRVVRSR
jgi:hypothetical protein